MSHARKAANLAGTVLPLLGLGIAIALLWDRMVGYPRADDPAVGLRPGRPGDHGRLSPAVHPPLLPDLPLPSATPSPSSANLRCRATSSAWVANHRKHHQFSDRQRRPAQPARRLRRRLPREAKGPLARPHRLVVRRRRDADRSRYAKDLVDDRGLRRDRRPVRADRRCSRCSSPALVGWAWIGGWYGFLAGLVWGGAVRILLLHHVTWSINSICHYWGRRRFAVRDESRNVWWLSWLSFGESWHNNHHAFPSSAFHGLRATRDRPRRLADPSARALRARLACRQDPSGTPGRQTATGVNGSRSSTQRVRQPSGSWTKTGSRPR